MSYVKQIRHEFEFDGMKVVATLKPLALEDSIRIKNTYEETGEKDAKGRALVRGTDATVKVMAELLPSYVVSLDGVVDAAGSPVPIGEICTAAYFIGLVASCMRKLVEESSPKNSNPSAEA